MNLLVEIHSHSLGWTYYTECSEEDLPRIKRILDKMGALYRITERKF